MSRLQILVALGFMVGCGSEVGAPMPTPPVVADGGGGMGAAAVGGAGGLGGASQGAGGVGGEACPGGCGACGECVSGACEPTEADVPCRQIQGICDAPERCDGVSLECPADELVPAGGDPVGVDDPVLGCSGAACDGLSVSCPETCDVGGCLGGLRCVDGVCE